MKKEKENKRRIELAEQHRNTRHDAIDAILEVFHEYQSQIDMPNEMFEKMESKIMNLKQREPNL